MVLMGTTPWSGSRSSRYARRASAGGWRVVPLTHPTATWPTARLASQWSNGIVFGTGASAMGNAVFAAGLFDPPWGKAAAPVVATGFGYDTTYPQGAYREALSSRWLTTLGFRYVIEDLYANEVRTPPRRSPPSSPVPPKVTPQGLPACVSRARVNVAAGGVAGPQRVVGADRHEAAEP